MTDERLCPKCGAPRDELIETCPKCGVIFAKLKSRAPAEIRQSWRGGTEEMRPGSQQVRRSARPAIGFLFLLAAVAWIFIRERSRSGSPVSGFVVFLVVIATLYLRMQFNRERTEFHVGGQGETPTRVAPNAITIIFCVLMGAFLGYCLGAYMLCEVFKYGGNLCFLPAFFIAAPLGAIVGGIIGWRGRR